MTISATTPVLMDRLKAETHADHAATEGVPFSSAMLERRLPRPVFIKHLQAMLVVHDALEGALSRSDDAAVRQVWNAELAKVPLLKRDLKALGGPEVDPHHPALSAAAGCAAALRTINETEPSALLGALYVLEGSTLGATILRGHISAMYDIDETTGLSYYSPYGNAVMPHWMTFKAAMNAAPLSEPQMKRIVETARGMFAHIGAILAALSAELDDAG
jgi:heme oxygenase